MNYPIPQKELIATAVGSWSVGYFLGPFGSLLILALGGVVYLTAQHVHRQYEVCDEEGYEIEETEEETEDSTDD